MKVEPSHVRLYQVRSGSSRDDVQPDTPRWGPPTQASNRSGAAFPGTRIVGRYLWSPRTSKYHCQELPGGDSMTEEAAFRSVFVSSRYFTRGSSRRALRDPVDMVGYGRPSRFAFYLRSTCRDHLESAVRANQGDKVSLRHAREMWASQKGLSRRTFGS